VESVPFYLLLAEQVAYGRAVLREGTSDAMVILFPQVADTEVALFVDETLHYSSEVGSRNRRQKTIRVV
jgi:hypothetical protein